MVHEANTATSQMRQTVGEAVNGAGGGYSDTVIMQL